jgi:XTP/dITP diphosphohydrolase
VKKIIVATSNKGKLVEIREILQDIPVELFSLEDYWNPIPEIAETGNTFLENAKIKADWVFEKSKIWSLSDDSGLEVDALGGEPGVRSARYAGDCSSTTENNRKLLNNLLQVPSHLRTARFRCVVVLKIGPEKYITAGGVCEGKIGFEICGDGGFGYDPLFIPDGYEKTFAQLESKEKHTLSHRGKALAALREQLHALLK